MRQLLPVPDRSADLSDSELVSLYADDSSGDRVRLNMVSTLDGAGVGADGRSGSINTAADHVVFQLLRAWADVILVGAGTARTEQYEPARTDPRWTALREGRPPHPAVAVVSGRAVLPELLHPDGAGGAVLLATSSDADPEAVHAARSALGTEAVLQHGRSSVDLAAVLRQLRAQGMHRVLCEGGPALAGTLIGAGLVDELCLTWSPRLVGATERRVLDAARLDVAATPITLLHEDGTLIGRWGLER